MASRANRNIPSAAGSPAVARAYVLFDEGYVRRWDYLVDQKEKAVKDGEHPLSAWYTGRCRADIRDVQASPIG